MMATVPGGLFDHVARGIPQIEIHLRAACHYLMQRILGRQRKVLVRIIVAELIYEVLIKAAPQSGESPVLRPRGQADLILFPAGEHPARSRDRPETLPSAAFSLACRWPGATRRFRTGQYSRSCCARPAAAGELMPGPAAVARGTRRPGGRRGWPERPARPPPP